MLEAKHLLARSETIRNSPTLAHRGKNEHEFSHLLFAGEHDAAMAGMGRRSHRFEW